MSRPEHHPIVFSPLSSLAQEDGTFHHDDELLPADEARRGRRTPQPGATVRIRAPQRPQQQDEQQQGGQQQQQQEAATAAATAAAAKKAAEADEDQEEDGWEKWEKFKEGTLPEEEMAYYRSLQELDAERQLPEWLQPKTSAEVASLKRNVSGPHGKGGGTSGS